MTKSELIQKLNKLGAKNQWGAEIEQNHWKADMMLLAFINDLEVTEAYSNIERWYS